MTRRLRGAFPCDRGDHLACASFSSSTWGLPCWCDCHERLSLSCKLGMHALCDRADCSCACGHRLDHRRVAERKRWAA